MRKKLRETLAQGLKEFGFDYEYMEENNLFLTGFYCNDEKYLIILIPEEDNDILLCWTRLRKCVAPVRRAVVAEYLTMINEKLCDNVMKMNWDDGEVLLYKSACYQDGKFTPPMLLRILASFEWQIKRFVPGLQAVASGETTAFVAYNEATKPSDNA